MTEAEFQEQARALWEKTGGRSHLKPTEWNVRRWAIALHGAYLSGFEDGAESVRKNPPEPDFLCPEHDYAHALGDCPGIEPQPLTAVEAFAAEVREHHETVPQLIEALRESLRRRAIEDEAIASAELTRAFVCTPDERDV